MRYDDFTIQSESYRKDFWNKMMKGQTAPYETMNKGAISSDTYVLPYDSNRKYMDVLKEECIFRQLATSIKSADSDLDIWVSDSDEQAEWAPSNTQQFIKDAAGQFDKKKVKCHKLAIITRMDRDFMQDVKFNMEKYLVKHFARRFGKAEEAAFVSGTGVDMPTGILHETDGAEVGITAKVLTFDNVIALYFSAKPEYRTHGTWLMNDETAKILRTLKDNDGNYLWNHNNDTIMGRPVNICNTMPSTGKVIAFGDFSYYCIINRMPISVRALVEIYIMNHQVGYLAHEYLDAKLIRPEAIKVRQLS